MADYGGYDRIAKGGPVRYVRVNTERPPAHALPTDIAERVMIDVIHDGAWIPDELLLDQDGERIPDEAFIHNYWIERDWGAAAIADGVCRQLGVPGFHNVELARVVMDFGRFPGLTHEDAGHLDRFALNYPFSELLSFVQKRRVLEQYYDVISEHFEAAVRSSVTKIAIHTYDKYNDSGTLRPEISVLTRATSYQAESEMPFGVFDPLYPDVLSEYTADRILRDRISLTFEKSGYPVAHNYPYTLPDGSIEVRAQVWNFFRYLRRRFEEHDPLSRAKHGFSLVWNMLLDTNLRRSDSEALRSYLFMFRRVAPEREADFAAAQLAYEQVASFLAANEDDLVTDYRKSTERLSTLGVEVRKDLVFDFDRHGVPIGPRAGAADEIATILARAIQMYYERDRPVADPDRIRLRATSLN